MALENILRKFRWILPVFSSLTIACNSCDGDKLSPTECDPKAAEICNNYKDDNCNGLFNEDCDNDNDGYCAKENRMEYTLGKLPEVCLKSYQNCLPSEECVPERWLFDCNDNRQEINPGAIEQCNYIDDDCDEYVDESFPEKGQKCGGNLELDGIGRCVAGTYTKCSWGRLECAGDIGPRDKEYCNSEPDDDCNGEAQNQLTEARQCYKPFALDANGRLVQLNFELDHPTLKLDKPPQQRGPCQSGWEFCIDNMVGGDGNCHLAIGPKYADMLEHDCDCINENCDDTVDEGLHVNYIIQFIHSIDISGSMGGYLPGIKEAMNDAKNKNCYDPDLIRHSTVTLGTYQPVESYDPIVVRANMSTEELSNNFHTDFPDANGPGGEEPSGNTILFLACTEIERDQQRDREQGITRQYNGEERGYLDLCAQIRPRNTLIDAILPEAERLVHFVFSDEAYHFVDKQRYEAEPQNLLPYVNQETAAKLSQFAGIKTIIFTEPVNNNLTKFENPDRFEQNEGYGYFLQYGGDVRDITSSNISSDINGEITLHYCDKD